MLSRRLSLILTACAVWTIAPAPVALAQPAPASITRIRTRYARIQSGVSKLRRVQMTPDEGADTEVAAYYDGTRLRKILYENLGEGLPRQYYYFWDNRLIFVHDTRHPNNEFARPLRQSRFYFNKGRLIRWADPSGRLIRGGSKFRQYEKDFLRAGESWLRITRERDFTRATLERGFVNVSVK